MPDEPRPRVEALPRDSAPQIVDVLCEAFRGYPVMRFVLGAGDAREAERLRSLVGLFVMSRVLRCEPLFGVRDGSDLVAAVTMSFPAVTDSPPELARLREETWSELGPETRSRYERCGAVWKSLTVSEPHVHVNMIGVRDAHRGRGLARMLLARAHEVSLATPGSRGVTLTTEDPANVPFYRHLGYETVGQARIAPALETWSLYRRSAPAAPVAGP